jgi:hypothetical protein
LIFKPLKFITLKSVYGQQRTGFDVADSKIYGQDIEFDLKEFFKFQTSDLTLGFSYVGRDEKVDIPDQKFNDLTNAFAGRINFNHNSFYASTEMNYKSKDAVVQVNDQVNNRLVKPGSALLINTGYSKKGFGIDATFRRLENMSFFSERGAKGNNFNDKIMNFIPSLTKQQHYNLANIYVYQAQPSVFLADQDLVKAGEIGGQIDVFYDIKKGTALGGKNGMKIAVNASNWNALSGTFYIFNPQDYQTDFLKFGKKYFKPKAIMLIDANGNEINFPEVEEGINPQVGDKGQIDGKPVEDGTYIMPSLNDASVTFVGGAITEITEVDSEMENLKKENENLKTQLSEMTANFENSNKKLTDYENEFKELKNKFTAKFNFESKKETKEETLAVDAR